MYLKSKNSAPISVQSDFYCEPCESACTAGCKGSCKGTCTSGCTGQVVHSET